jgi:hypothetical protein
MHRRLAPLLTAALLAGCVAAAPPPPLMSPYPAAGHGYGYSEERIGPDLLRVVYHGPPRPLDPAAPARATQLDRAASEAADLALWRAAQLALAAGKPAFAVVERRADTETLSRPGGWTHDPWWPDDCFPSYGGHWRCRGWPASYVPPRADGRARATLTVRLENRVTRRNVDAAAAIRRLGRVYAPPSAPRP